MLLLPLQAGLDSPSNGLLTAAAAEHEAAGSRDEPDVLLLRQLTALNRAGGMRGMVQMQLLKQVGGVAQGRRGG
jgi:hypothetical protein